jgi:hypothetical protein
MRLGVFRCETHCVAGVVFGLADGAVAEQQEGGFVGGPEIIGLECDDAADQGGGGGADALRFADFVKDGEGGGAAGSELEDIERQAFGGFRFVGAEGLHGPVLDRDEVAMGFGGAEGGDILFAAAGAAEAAAAGAGLEIDVLHDSLAPPLRSWRCKHAAAGHAKAVDGSAGLGRV